MNKILLVLNILLVIAVSFLLYKVLGNDAPAEDEKGTIVTQKADNLPVTSKIAFVREDTINEKYAFLKDRIKTLEAEEKRMQGILEAEVGKLQKRYGELQQKAPTMTQQDMEAAQIELQQRQQQIEEQRYNLTQQLEEKRAQMQKDFFDKLNAYLKKYNEKQKFDYILTYGTGGAVLLAKDTLDITKDIINGLNQEYQESKAKK